ncbi:LysR family transcriptional regulator, partial [Burkholderia cenocepacia]
MRLSTEVLGGAWDALISRRAELVVGAAGEPPEVPRVVALPSVPTTHEFATATSHPLASQPAQLAIASVFQSPPAGSPRCARALHRQSVAAAPRPPGRAA